jgi:hypothetical protein
VEADRLAAGVVVQPDAVAKQDRHDVQVDLVDQSQLEQLTADGGREHLEVLAVGRRQPDPHRLGRAAGQERDAVGGRRVLGVMGEDEDRPLPRAAVRAAAVDGLVPAVPAAQDGARRRDVLLVQARTDADPGHPVHRVIRPGHEPVQGDREVKEHLPVCGLRLGVAHRSPPVICLQIAIGRAYARTPDSRLQPVWE